MRRFSSTIEDAPLVSILMPVLDSTPDLAGRAIESVVRQVYDGWELCVAISEATPSATRRVVEDFRVAEPRLKVVQTESSGRPDALNSALGLAEGVVAAIVDADSVLPPHALLLVASALSTQPDAGLVYSDEDEIDDRGRRFDPNFKPDWNPALFLASGYVGRLAAFRTDLAREVGGLRPEFAGR